MDYFSLKPAVKCGKSEMNAVVWQTSILCHCGGETQKSYKN